MRPCVHVHLSTAHAVSVSIMCLTDWALPESMCPRLYVRASTRATFFLFFFFLIYVGNVFLLAIETYLEVLEERDSFVK